MEAKKQQSEEKEKEIRDVIILGTGCSGLTAALYTARANLNPLVLHGDTPGGQLVTTTLVENYPGFLEGIDGNTLIETMEKQATRFGAQFEYGIIEKVNFSKFPFELSTSNSGTTYFAKSVIIATGARPRKLGIPSESAYWGKGVTSCATCDGYFFKGEDVCVIGGGDSAMEEANFLTRMCRKVYVIHRRDHFTASKIMSDRTLKNPKIEIVWNSFVETILGEDGSVSGVRVKNVLSNTTMDIALKGVFLAIGHIPNTDPFKGILSMDENGYLITKSHSTRTNIDGVFGCGDCQDHVFRQAVTAAGTGCMAAIEVERWLEKQQQA